MKYFRIITISRILRQLHGGGSYDILHLHSDRTGKKSRHYFFNSQ